MIWDNSAIVLNFGLLSFLTNNDTAKNMATKEKASTAILLYIFPWNRLCVMLLIFSHCRSSKNKRNMLLKIYMQYIILLFSTILRLSPYPNNQESRLPWMFNSWHASAHRHYGIFPSCHSGDGNIWPVYHPYRVLKRPLCLQPWRAESKFPVLSRRTSNFPVPERIHVIYSLCPWWWRKP